MRMGPGTVLVIWLLAGCAESSHNPPGPSAEDAAVRAWWDNIRGHSIGFILLENTRAIRATDGECVWTQDLETSSRSSVVALEGPLPAHALVRYLFSDDASWLALVDSNEITLWNAGTGKRFYSGCPVAEPGRRVDLPRSSSNPHARGTPGPLVVAFLGDGHLLAAGTTGYAGISLTDGSVRPYRYAAADGVQPGLAWDHVWSLGDGTVVCGWYVTKDDFMLVLIRWNHPEDLRTLPVDREEVRDVELSRDHSKLYLRVAVRNPDLSTYYGPPEGLYMNHRIEVYDRKELSLLRRLNFQEDDSWMMPRVPRSPWSHAASWWRSESIVMLEDCVRWLSNRD